MTTVSGVYTCRNSIEVGYPFVEAILSALPLCDEFLINDGGSVDGTLATEHEPRIRRYEEYHAS